MDATEEVRALRDIVRPWLMDPELRRLLPLRPRLAPECTVHTTRDDVLVVAGGRDTLVVRGREAITELLPIVRALDGEGDCDALATGVADGRRARVLAVVALLASCGLVEDATARDGDKAPPRRLSGMLGSGVGRTLALPSREAAWRKVCEGGVWLGGTDAGGALPALEAELREVVALRPDPSECALGLFITDDASAMDHARVDALVASGLPVLLVERAAARTALGPLFVREAGPTARCHAEARASSTSSFPAAEGRSPSLGLSSPCVSFPGGARSGRPGVGGTDDSVRLAAFVALVAHYATALLARGVTRPLIGMSVEMDALGATGPRRATEVRHVRGADGTLSAVPERVRREAAWGHHVRVQDLPARFRPVRGYEVHFTPAVLAMTAAGRPLPGGRRHGFGPEAGAVAEVCRLALGANPLTGRPYAPSGGGLRSPSLFVHLHEAVGDVPPGTWLYDEAGPALVGVPGAGLSLDEREAVFRDHGDARPRRIATLVVTGGTAILARKYGPKALNLACVDAGVLAVHVALGVEAVGQTATLEEGLREGDVLRACGLAGERESAFVSFVFSLSLSVPASVAPEEEAASGERGGEVSPALLAPRRRTWPGPDGPLMPGIASSEELEALLRLRVACRELDGPLRLGDVASAVAVGEAACEALVGDRHAVRWTGVTDDRCDAGPGVWSFRDGMAAGLSGESPGVRGRDLVLQERLGDAPCVLLPCVDLRSGIGRGGSSGYRSTATATGVALAAFWLEAARLGLAGSPCGGFVGGALRSWGVDGCSTAAMLSFGIGRARRTETGDSARGRHAEVARPFTVPAT